MQRENGCLPVTIAVIGGFFLVLMLCTGLGLIYASKHYHPPQPEERPAAEPAPEPEPNGPVVARKPDVVTSSNGALVRDRSLRLDGRYEVASNVRLGNFKLERLNLGRPEEFAAFEGGNAAARPMVFVFGDTTSKSRTTDIDTTYAAEVRLVCRHYTLTRETVDCAGSDADIGEVSFHGKLDATYVAKSAVSGGPETYFLENALTGDLTVGGQVFKAVSFTYWRDY